MILARKVAGTSAISVFASAINLVTTVLVVRIFGSHVYADFIVDLAIISLVAIFLEVVPSNYLLFKVQDSDEWRSSLRSISVLTGFLVVLGVLFVQVVDGFKQYDFWMYAYAFGLAVKRYNDINYQSQGKLFLFMLLELGGASLKLVLMIGMWAAQIVTMSGVWFSVAASLLVPSLLATMLEGRGGLSFSDFLRMLSLIFKRRKEYLDYYLGIFFKRLKDNFVPIAGSIVVSDSAKLAIFFLAYRGVTFAVGQLRIIESFLYHRESFARIERVRVLYRLAVLVAVYCASVVSSYFIMLFSGVVESRISIALGASLIVVPVVLNMLERAKALSRYLAKSINYALGCYLIFFIAGLLLLRYLGLSTLFALMSLVIASEFGSYFVFLLCKRKFLC